MNHRYLFHEGLLRGTFTAENRKLCRDFIKVSIPVILSGLVWAISIPMQTTILGHFSSDATAANSVATTFFQYLKKECRILRSGKYEKEKVLFNKAFALSV